MTFKEEIREYLKTLPLRDYVRDANIELYTNSILMRVVKLIDEKIDNLHLENWWTEQDDIKKALEELKQEILEGEKKK